MPVTRKALSGRGTARLSLAFGVAAVLTLLLSAGFRSISLLIVGAAGLALTVGALWWVLTHRGAIRMLAIALAVATPVAVLAYYVALGQLWPVIVSLALWAAAASAARVALGRDVLPATAAERPTQPPHHPFLIMNPRSGGGKVARFGLEEKAAELGAEVVMLDSAHPVDVAELAHQAVESGADLLGVAGGDGTQALVAGVAAQHDVPFMVISAGTRNHFALDLGLDRDDPSTGLGALTDGVEILVDLGYIGDRVFVNNASFGAYAAVVQSPAYRDDKVHTTLEMLPELLTQQTGARLTVSTSGVTIEAPQAVLVSNNPYQGGDPAGLGRRERLDSGSLGVLGVTVGNAAQAAGMLRGRRGSGLTAMTAYEVVVDADIAEIPVGVDGEALILPTPVTCRIQPSALRVRVPRNRPGPAKLRPRLNWPALTHLAFARGEAETGR